MELVLEFFTVLIGYTKALSGAHTGLSAARRIQGIRRSATQRDQHCAGKQPMESAMFKCLAIIGAPSSASAYVPGQEKIPTALRAAGVLQLLSD